jgi:hypothetical protein
MRDKMSPRINFIEPPILTIKGIDYGVLAHHLEHALSTRCCMDPGCTKDLLLT